MKATERTDGGQIRAILISMVTDPGVLGAVAARWDGKLFGDCRWANVVGGWCVKYHQKYRKAPGKHLTDLYEQWSNSTDRDKDTVKLVESFLTALSDEYDKDPAGRNTDYVLDLCGRYFNSVRLKELGQELQALVEAGDVEKAEQLRKDFNRVEVGQGAGVSLLRDEAAVLEVGDQSSEVLIQYPDALGEFFGDTLSRDSFVAILAPEKRGKCVSEDMEVLLADGRLVRIGDVVSARDHTPVLAYDGDLQRFVPKEPCQFWDNGKKEVFKVTTRSGRELETTDNHLYLTPEGWRPLSQIAPGGFIAVAKRTGVFGSQEMDKHKVRFAAFMLAEGGCTATQMNFTNTDPILIKEFESTCDSLGISYSRKGICHRLRHPANQISKELGFYGCSAKTKKVPEQVFTAPKEQVAEFLRVFFSCDGSIHKDRNGFVVQITLANKKLTTQIGHLLTRFGIVYKFGHKMATCGGRKFPAWRINIGSQEYVRMFLQEINFLSYKRTDPKAVSSPGGGKSFLDKFPWQVAKEFYECLKMEGDPSEILGTKRAESIRQQIAKKKPLMRRSFEASAGTHFGKKYLGSVMMWDEVESVESAGTKQTYDIAVPKLHNFVCNDVITHNSFWQLDIGWTAMTQKRRVAYFEVGDMSQRQVIRRLLVRASKTPRKPGKVKYPTKLFHEEDKPYSEVELADLEFDKGMDPAKAWKKLQKLAAKLGDDDLFRLSVHPNSTLKVDGIKAILDGWDRRGWFPDVICLAQGSLVLTQRGLVPIEDVKGCDRLWDGVEWVSHGGAVYKGVKQVISYGGLTATPDHLVHTNGGWRTFESSKRLRLRITRTGFGRQEVRVGGDHLRYRENKGGQLQLQEVRLCAMCAMQIGKVDTATEFEAQAGRRLSPLPTAQEVSQMALEPGIRAAAAVSESQLRYVGQLWGQGNRVPLPFGAAGVYLADGEFGCPQAPRVGDRPQGQRRPLRTGQPTARDSEAKLCPHDEEPGYPKGTQVPRTLPTCVVCGRNVEKVFANDDGQRSDCGLELHQKEVWQSPVWDILNAGPRNRFTVQGLLVHNCIDYADILAPPSGVAETRDQINATWKQLRALNQETHCCLVTATQANAASYSNDQLGMANFSEDKRKFAHVTGMFALNQTSGEKREGLYRLNWVVLRENEFTSDTMVHVAGCLALARPAVLSTF